eukprot:6181647-Pleurochrysis_carterae.AAC.6
MLSLIPYRYRVPMIECTCAHAAFCCILKLKLRCARNGVLPCGCSALSMLNATTRYCAEAKPKYSTAALKPR